MFLFEIFAALAWLLVPLLLLYLIFKPKKNYGQGQNYSDQSNTSNDADKSWLTYIRSFQEIVKTKAEKKLIEALLAGKSADQLYSSSPVLVDTQAELARYESIQTATLVEPVTQAQSNNNDAPIPPVKYYRTPVDNSILLLYFGAFLLVAAVGLFVAISGLGGFARTLIVALTAAVLYSGGLWLYKNNKKLEQAGISFVGTGLIIAPLVGVAWYNLVLGETYAGPVWLVTSLACIALYVHAYSKIKNDFISYLLIGSFVSSVESAVLTIDLPSYGYAWGLVVAGLLLAITNRRGDRPTQLDAASSASSRLLIPLSVLGSLLLLPEFGTFQLAVTLLLTGTYYGLLAWWNIGQRSVFSLAAQVSYISALASSVYALNHSLSETGIAMVVVGALYALAISMFSMNTIRVHNLINTALIVNTAAIILCLGSAWPLVASLVIAVILAGIVWYRFQYESTLQVGCLILLGLPFVAGQYALKLELASWPQLTLCAVSALLLGALVAVCGTQKTYKPYYETASMMYMLAASLLLIPAWELGYGAITLVTAVVFSSFVGLRYLAKDADWLLGSSVVLLVPFIHAAAEYGIDSWQFSLGVGIALVGNIIISLATRHSVIRYIVVGCILLAPLALGGGGIGWHWGATGYTGGYLLAMASCVLARAIARGRLLLSSKVPISSYYKEASEAYVLGYSLTAIISLVLSFNSDKSQLITSLVLVVLGVFVVIIAGIEKNNQLYALLPVIVQAILFSALRPDFSSAETVGAMSLVSVLVAAGCYALNVLTDPTPDAENSAGRWVSNISVMTAYIGPMLVIFSESRPSLLLPFSLFIAGLLTYLYNRRSPQGTKELSAAVCIASVHWFIYLLGYTNIHLHTHVLALFLAGFAVWRDAIGDRDTSLSYVKALFFVVTVPLALQAMGGENGGTYGLILIAEQVGFMVFGASFGQRFLLRWGLWTGLAAILFQLRGLGWAFLSLLAIIVIGVAVYRLQKHAPPDNKPDPRE